MAKRSNMYFCINKNILNKDSNANDHTKRFSLIKQDQQNVDDYLDQLVNSVSQEWHKEFRESGNLWEIWEIEGNYYEYFKKLSYLKVQFHTQVLKMFLKLVYYHLYDKERLANIRNEWETYCNNRNGCPVIREIEFYNLSLYNVNLSKPSFYSCSFINSLFIDVNFSNTTFRDADFSKTEFINVNFSKTEFINVNFSKATLTDTNFSKATLTNTNFSKATLTDTNFSKATLDTVDFPNVKLNYVIFNNTRCRETNFYGTDFSTSTANGMFFKPSEKHSISDIQLTNVNLNNINISEELKSVLEYNRRKYNWEVYYDYPEKPVSLTEPISEISKYKILLSPIIIIHCFFYNAFIYLRSPIKTAINLFWWSTNYGYSTLRIFFTLSIISLIFSGIYLIGYYTNNPLIELTPKINTINYDIDSQNLIKNKLALNNIQIVLRSIYFSIVTMTTLGFGDITVNPASYVGHIIVSIQVILGYIGLGALITRIGTLFNSAGLTTTPKEYNKKHKGQN